MNAALLSQMESSKPVHRASPKNPGLLELIRAKREQDWKPSVEEVKKGFRGWHQRGYLPHFDAPWCSARHRDEYERLPWQRGDCG